MESRLLQNMYFRYLVESFVSIFANEFKIIKKVKLFFIRAFYIFV